MRRPRHSQRSRSRSCSALPRPTAAGPQRRRRASTGIALDGRVELAWQPVAGATAYTVYRGTHRDVDHHARLTRAGGVTGTTFTDTTAANGTTYYYAVRAVASGDESANSLVVQATPPARACSTGNAVVRRELLPGQHGLETCATPAAIASGGIEGYATAASINQGDSVDLKVNADAARRSASRSTAPATTAAPARGSSPSIRGVPGVRQPACSRRTRPPG